MTQYPLKESLVGNWLSEKRQREHLSLRQVAVKTGLSHTAIAEIIKGTRPSRETIIKLSQAFGGDGLNQRLALEALLLVLGGYMTPRPEEQVSETMAILMDRVSQFSNPQLEMMVSFAEFLAKIEKPTKSID